MDRRSRDDKPGGAGTGDRPTNRPQHQPLRGPPPPPRSRFEPVDREKTCPLLLRVFTQKGGHHTKEDFAVRGKEPKDEVQIYTWKDATLRELTDLVKEVHPEARKREAKLSFAFVYPDRYGRFVVRQVGITYSNGNKRNLDETKTLSELNFQLPESFGFIFTWFAAVHAIVWLSQVLTRLIVKYFIILKGPCGTENNSIGTIKQTRSLLQLWD